MRGTRGFSILELMVVVGIMAIAASMAIPGYFSWKSKQSLLKASSEVMDLIPLARMAAIKENAPVVVSFNPANRSYVVFVDDGAGVAAYKDNGSRDANERGVRAGVLSGTEITLATSFSDNKLLIDGRGLLTSSGSVTLSHPQLGAKQVAITLTGMARLQ